MRPMPTSELYDLVANAWWASLTEAEREDLVKRAAGSGKKRLIRAARQMAGYMRQKALQADVIMNRKATT